MRLLLAKASAAAWILGLGTSGVLAQTAGSDPCSLLVGMRIETGSIISTQRLAAGQSLGGMLSEKASTALCRVHLQLRPVQGSDIRGELWLPEGWNRKLIAYGGGGFSGGIAQSESAMNANAARGYATLTSDLGHPVSATARWARQNPEGLIDFGHRANHVLAVAAKQVVQAFYKEPVRRAYFQGCSGGGREALMEVTRFPGDFDGVIAGSPALDFGGIMAQMIWNDQVMATAPTLYAKLPSVNKAVMGACDALDGVKDNVLENPMQCRFDPAVLQCKLFDTRACLNKAELLALRKLYEGPRLKGGERLVAGPALGSEGAGWVLSGIMTSIGGPEFYRWMVYGEPRWSAATFNLDRDYPYARTRLGTIVDGDNPDIGHFASRGSKLILYHGWADTLISPLNTLRYYDKVRALQGSRADDSVRLFMVPGLPHCGEGIDMLPALEAWVEEGRAPDQAILKGKKRSGLFNEQETTRLLCPWPRTARYRGSGSTTDAAHFACVDPS